MLRGIQSLGVLKVSHRATPVQIAGSALSLWCSRRYRQLPPSAIPSKKVLIQSRAVSAFVRQLERLEFLDAAYWLSTAYATLSTEEYRKTLAMYFTPPPIAKRLIADLQREGARFGEDSVVDPACGGAAFLALVASCMRDALLKRNARPATILKHAESHLAGADLDKTLCALTEHFLHMVFYPEICATGRRPKFRIECVDSLRRCPARRRYDVVVCNPPFRKLSATEADDFRHDFSELMQGQPNLYALFMGLAVRLAKPSGIVGLVTPTSFVSGQYFASVRTFLLNEARVRHVGLVRQRERVYLDVEQETALTVLRAGPLRRKRVPRPAISVLESDGRYVRVGRCPLPNSGTSWPLAREAADVAMLERASKSPFRLFDYGYAPSVGAFVWNRDPRPAYMTQAQIPRAKRPTAIPLLWSSDVRRGGRLQFETHECAHGQHRYVHYAQKDQFIIKRRPAVLLQRVTSSDQPRRLVGAVVSEQFVREHGGYVGENHTLILEQVSDGHLPPRQLLALLDTSMVDRYFRCLSGSTNVSVFELEQLPLPDPEELKLLLSDGVSIEEATTRLLLKGGGNRTKKPNKHS